MNILFFNQSFYTYDKAITDALISSGNKVYEYCIRTPKKFFSDLKGKVIGNYKAYHKDSAILQGKIISELKENNVSIDVVFVLSGQFLEESTLKTLKEMYPRARFVWYIWDAIYRLDEYKSNGKYFDSIITFDINEAKEYDLGYLPLFYMQEVNNKDKQYKCSFVGQIHSNRAQIISQAFSGMEKDSFIFLKVTKVQYWKYKLSSKYKNIKEYMRKDSLKYDEVVKAMSTSKSVLDIPYKNQKGLTMRTVECIGMHTKLITTNPTIVDYDFYDSNNIYVMDENNIKLPGDEFFNSPYCELDELIQKKYSFDYWINTLIKVFNGENQQ